MTSSSPSPAGSGNRHLIIMRHGKAEAFAEEDQRRRLTERGHRDAAEAGAWLVQRGLVPTQAFVSAAPRATATWDHVAQQTGPGTAVTVDGSLYSAGPQTVVDALRTAPQDAGVVMFVGHNPTAALLAHLLDDGSADPNAFRTMSQGFPTCAMAVLAVDVPWSELGPASARLVEFHAGSG